MNAVRAKSYTFLGGGIIAEVFIERLQTAGEVPPEKILVTDVRPERLDLVGRRFGVATSTDNCAGAAFGEVVFLAVPPAAVQPVLEQVRNHLRPEAVLISLAAAVTTTQIEAAVRRPVPVLRVIPNTPSLIGRGMNPHCLGSHVGAGHQAFFEELLGLFGDTIRLPEQLMNAATALTAVGPTYVFPVIQSLSQAAVRLGLPELEARRAAAATVAGSAQLVLETGKDPNELKLMIGTRTLEEGEADKLFSAAIETAHEKISALAKRLTNA